MSTTLTSQTRSLDELVSQFSVHRSTSPLPVEERVALTASPKFGTVFTDHMTRMTWTVDEGWHNRRVEPYGPLHMDPAAAVLHYGQEILKG